MSHQESKSVAPGASKARRLAAAAALGVAALAVPFATTQAAGAAERAYSPASCSLSAVITGSTVVFSYTPPDTVARNFGLHVVGGGFVGGATLQPGTSSEPISIDPALDYEVQYVGRWYTLADVADCAFPPVATTVPPATVPEPSPTTVPEPVVTVAEPTTTVPLVIIGDPVGPLTAPSTTAGVEVLSSSVTARALPNTGRPTGQLLLLGGSLLGLGAWVCRTGRRMRLV